MVGIPFSEPYQAPEERNNLDMALTEGLRSVSGRYSLQSRDRLKKITGGGEVFLTTSGSSALELALLVAEIGPDDEVILPSFTFTSVANAIALRGAIPVFIDVDPTSLNITAELIAPAITARTRAVIVVHYAGVVADMDPIVELAHTHGLVVIEDAAHAIGSMRDGRPAGSFGDFAAFSFHYTKNVSCGEGGCLVVNDRTRVAAAEIAFEKGTNRSAFVNGLVDKYSWVAIGSSFTLSELNAAVLDAQLAALDAITAERRRQWHRYASALADWAPSLSIAMPQPVGEAQHNAHLFHLILESDEDRPDFIAHMRRHDITTPFHYVPLHSAPAGQRFGRTVGEMTASDMAGGRLVRLPLYPGLGDNIDRVIAAVLAWGEGRYPVSRLAG